MEIKRCLFYAYLFLTASLSVVLVACGGGGGGGAASGISYTGVTTQAIIDDNNAEDIATGSMVGGEISSNLSILGAVRENSDTAGSFLGVDIATYLHNIIYEIENSNMVNTAYLGAIQSGSETIDGSCGGNISFNITGDDQTGNFNGSLTFNNFCEPEFTANGSTNISGNININTGEFSYFDMSFTNIVMNSEAYSISMHGNISLNFQPPMRMTMSFVFIDNQRNKTYKYENFVYEYVQGSGFTDMTFTGRYFDHDYGYVNLSTETPFRIYDNDFWPSSGAAIATGDLGTKAKLSAINSSSFIVEADTDGDGLFDDYSSGAIFWAAI